METFIIAEVGSNWESFEDALESVRRAAKAGANAVKFQMFSEHDLYGIGETNTNLDLVQIERLADKATASGIEFMCTVFSPKRVKDIDPFVKRHKIASSEMMYGDLLRACIATSKQVIVSTGGHDLISVEIIYERYLKYLDTVLLYCCNAYPSKLHDLKWIDYLIDNYDCPIGFSDHSIDAYTPYAACKYHHAQYLEKHVKIRDMSTPDDPHSVTFDVFESIVRMIRHDEYLPFRNVDELDARNRHNRRLIATRPITSGDVLKYGVNFGLYRSKKDSLAGLELDYVHSVDETRAFASYSPGDTILLNGPE